MMQPVGSWQGTERCVQLPKGHQMLMGKPSSFPSHVLLDFSESWNEDDNILTTWMWQQVMGWVQESGVIQAKASSWPGAALRSIPTEVVHCASTCSSSSAFSCFSREINSDLSTEKCFLKYNPILPLSFVPSHLLFLALILPRLLLHNVGLTKRGCRKVSGVTFCF